MVDLISSAGNPLVKRMRLLADRKHRRREGAFVVHGIQPVWQAVESGAEIETLVAAPGLLGESPAAGLVAEQEVRGSRVTRVTDELFARLSDRDGPSGLAAIVRMRTARLGDLAVDQQSLFVALHEIGNPGNLGTIIRTADAVGAAGTILIGQTTDPFDPSAVRASMGALFQVPVAHTPSVEEFFDWAGAHRVAVATTSARADHDLWTAGYPLPLVILLGSEGSGLPAPVLARGDLRLRIPIVGKAESLNLAVAAGVMLYEVRRRFPAGYG